MNLQLLSPPPRRSSRGFTLIELLVTVSIMVIMIGGSIAGFLSFRERQSVLNTAKDVQQFLRTAQSKARVRETPEQCKDNVGLRLLGYRVAFGTSLYIQALCGPDTNPPVPTQAITTSESYTVSGVTMTISPSLATSTIDFYTLHRGTTIPSQTEFRFESASNKFKFKIEPSGAISDVEKYD